MLLQRRDAYHHINFFPITIGVWVLHSTNFSFLPEMALSGVESKSKRVCLCVCVYIYLHMDRCACTHTFFIWKKKSLNTLCCILHYIFSSLFCHFLSSVSDHLCIFYKTDKPMILLVCMCFSLTSLW